MATPTITVEHGVKCRVQQRFVHLAAGQLQLPLAQPRQSGGADLLAFANIELESKYRPNVK